MAQSPEELELSALGVPHPSPHRDRIPMWKLVVPLYIPPLIWLARLCFSYAMISTACGKATESPARGMDAFHSPHWVVALIVNIVSILVILGIGLMALRLWKRGGGEHDHPRDLLLDVGEGRTSFMAHWGILVSFGFLLVTIFDTIPMAFVPVCGF